MSWGKALISHVKEKGYVEHNGVFYPPNSPQAELLHKNQTIGPKKKSKRSKAFKTGWVDDSRNIKNKEKQTDVFIQLIKQELQLEVWPEFYFSTQRLYRVDYAIPISQDEKHLKIAIEVDGGIYAKGNSGHSSGTGIKRDMDKNNLLVASGWRLIRVTPSELITLDTINAIKNLL